MTNRLSLTTVKEKITELKTALFYDLSYSVLKQPVSIIQLLSVDELGQIWFVLPYRSNSPQIFEKEFFSELHFFNKAKDFYLNLTGNAFWVHDPEELNYTDSIPDEMKNRVVCEELILLKVSIKTADYFVRKVHPPKKDYRRVISQLYYSLFSYSQTNYFNYEVLHLER
jgi:hypothetical protein